MNDVLLQKYFSDFFCSCAVETSSFSSYGVLEVPQAAAGPPLENSPKSVQKSSLIGVIIGVVLVILIAIAIIFCRRFKSEKSTAMVLIDPSYDNLAETRSAGANDSIIGHGVVFENSHHISMGGSPGPGSYPTSAVSSTEKPSVKNVIPLTPLSGPNQLFVPAYEKSPPSASKFERDFMQLAERERERGVAAHLASQKKRDVMHSMEAKQQMQRDDEVVHRTPTEHNVMPPTISYEDW